MGASRGQDGVCTSKRSAWPGLLAAQVASSWPQAQSQGFQSGRSLEVSHLAPHFTGGLWGLGLSKGPVMLEEECNLVGFLNEELQPGKRVLSLLLASRKLCEHESTPPPPPQACLTFAQP